MNEAILRKLIFPEIILEESPRDRCPAIIEAARQFYAEPLPDLRYKKPLLEMYKDSGTDETYGEWVAGVTKPGDVAACVNYKPKKQQRGRDVF